MSSDDVRELQLQQVAGFATRLARTQIKEAEQAFSRATEGDEELNLCAWEAYIAHIAARLADLVGDGTGLAVLRGVISAYEKNHDH